jgi:hypothetical protein
MEEIDHAKTDRDIRCFLEARFRRLRLRKELLDAHPDAIEASTTRAEGLFIYARTVMDYLEGDSHSPASLVVQRFPGG